MDRIQALAIISAVIVFSAFIMLILGLINPLYFWIIMIIAAITYYVVPTLYCMREEHKLKKLQS